MKSKICGLKYPENVLAVKDCKPDYIGFIFYEHSPRYVGNTLSPEFVQQLKDVKKVGVFVSADEMTILDHVSRYGLDLVQLHGNETADFCRNIQTYVPVIKAFGMVDHFDFEGLKEYEEACRFYLFDTQTRTHGGSGKKFNWDQLTAYQLKKPFFLSGGIDLNALPLIEKIRLTNQALMGIDVNSCFETAPGVKDINKIKKLIKKIKK